MSFKEAIKKQTKTLAELEWELEKISFSHEVDPQKHPLHEVVQDRKQLFVPIDVVLAEFDKYEKEQTSWREELLRKWFLARKQQK